MQRSKGTGDFCPITHHICSLIFFPLSSTVLILKSTPMRGNQKHTCGQVQVQAFPVFVVFFKNQQHEKEIDSNSLKNVMVGNW